MKNKKLALLNFRDLIDYEGVEPLAEHRYIKPLICHRYCIHCKNSGLSHALISHAADTSDFESILGPLPKTDKTFNDSVLFLLESPGSDYGNGEAVKFHGFMKVPPTKHYYWSPNVSRWPTSPPSNDSYGSYFAYLMKKHGLSNVYITNTCKCNWPHQELMGVDSKAIVHKCIEQFLQKEISILKPRIAFCFGRKAETGLRWCLQQSRRTTEDPIICYLYHPAARMARVEMIKENDRMLQKALKQWAFSGLNALKISGQANKYKPL